MNQNTTEPESEAQTREHIAEEDHKENEQFSTSRRNLLRATAIGVGAAAVPGAAHLSGNSPVGDAEAVAPAVLYFGAVSAGWLLRSYTMVAADTPTDGTTSEILIGEAMSAFKTRESTNASTFIDNRNLIELGFKNSLYSEGKIAAINAINNGATEAATLTAAQDAANASGTTVVKNLLKSWNESVLELDSYYSRMKTDLTSPSNYVAFSAHDSANNTYNEWELVTFIDANSTTLPDGTTFSTHALGISLTGTPDFDPTTNYNTRYTEQKIVFSESGDIGTSVDGGYLLFDEWNAIYTDLNTVITDVNNGLATWVSSIYSQVQSGELDTSQLLTPAELAALSSTDATYSQASADLAALNIPADFEREAEVYIPSLDATVYGNLAYTGTGELSTGTIDPTADAESYYLTYDISQGVGNWADFQLGIDGGILTFTAEPYAETVYTVSTEAGETVDVVAGDFTDSGTGTWTVDLSTQLENPITNVASIEYRATTDTVQYETVQLTDPFEIISFTGSDGTTYTSTSFVRSAPQDDTNYITEAEWKEMEQRYNDIIADLEGGSGGGALFGGSSATKLLGVGGVAAAVYALLNRGDSPGQRRY